MVILQIQKYILGGDPLDYKIGSFNLKNFGANSKKDLEKIAQIITEEQLDVVALQEILSEGKGVKRLLEQCVKYELYDWDFCCASPRESTDLEKISDMVVNDTRGECYAYLWNKKKFKLVEMTKLGQNRIFEPRIINSLSNDVEVDCSVFARAPYYIRLQPLFGGFFELRLINIHIYYGSNRLSSIAKRIIEYDLLTHDIYPNLSTRRYGNFRTAYTVAMGDYNLNIYTPGINTVNESYLIPVYSYVDGQKTVRVVTDQKDLSTLKRSGTANREQLSGYANNYDHFTYSPELSNFNRVSFAAIDAVNKYCKGDFEYYNNNISDHVPIVMNINI